MLLPGFGLVIVLWVILVVCCHSASSWLVVFGGMGLVGAVGFGRALWCFDLLRFGVWLASLLSGFGLGFAVVLCLLCGGFMFGLVDFVLGCCDVVVCLPVWFDRWVWWFWSCWVLLLCWI